MSRYIKCSPSDKSSKERCVSQGARGGNRYLMKWNVGGEGGYVQKKEFCADSYEIERSLGGRESQAAKTKAQKRRRVWMTGRSWG